jgi:hypothetical protein
MRDYIQTNQRLSTIYYPKAALVNCLLILLSACDQQQFPLSAGKDVNQDNPTPQVSARTAEIKWAVANKYKLTEAIKEALTKADPEIEANDARYIEAVNERKSLIEQIEHSTQAIKDRCADEKNKNSSQEIHLKDDRHSGEQGGFSVTISELEDFRRGSNNPNYMDCVKQSKNKDQQIIDLQGKLARINNLSLEKNQSEQIFRERVNTTFTQMVSTYGEMRGYQLIIGNGSSEVLFNQSNVVLDVTGDLLEFIAQQPIASKQPPPSVPK